MAIQTVTIQWGQPSGDAEHNIPLAVGSSVIVNVSMDWLKSTWGDKGTLTQRLDRLIGQMMKVIDDAGLDPATATMAQIKAATEAQTYKV